MGGKGEDGKNVLFRDIEDLCRVAITEEKDPHVILHGDEVFEALKFLDLSHLNDHYVI